MEKNEKGKNLRLGRRKSKMIGRTLVTTRQRPQDRDRDEDWPEGEDDEDGKERKSEYLPARARRGHPRSPDRRHRRSLRAGREAAIVDALLFEYQHFSFYGFGYN